MTDKKRKKEKGKKEKRRKLLVDVIIHKFCRGNPQRLPMDIGSRRL